MKTALAIAFVATLILSSSLSGIGIFLLLKHPNPGLCEYVSPRIITTRVSNHPEPSVNTGRAVSEIGQRCVQGTTLLNVYAYRYIEPMTSDGYTDPSRERVISLNGLEQARAQGNTYQEENVQLPPEVTPGLWRLSGIDLVPQTGEFRAWFSQTFTVVGP